MALGAYDDTIESFHDDVSMRLAFRPDRLFSSFMPVAHGLPWAKRGQHQRAGPVRFWTDVGSDDLARVWLD